MNTRILALLRWELLVVLLALAALAWGTNMVLERKWDPARRRLMKGEFIKLRNAIGAGLVMVGVVALAQRLPSPESAEIIGGLIALAVWVVIALRVARVCAFEWLFAQSAREGVPALLVDLFTLVAALFSTAAVLHAVFLIEVMSLIATSAVVSVVLGLALQDTLGHLFAGIALQFDRPFRLGDWIEIRLGNERVSGQVLELSWRATVLLAITDEVVTVPNKTVAQGLVLNYSGRERPFVRSHVFRVGLTAPVARVKELLCEAARETPGVLAEPAPLALIHETTDSWIAVKAICFIADFGQQYIIGDAFQARALELLEQERIPLATSRLRVESDRALTTA
jgi:small-conductance mechanosensitive channel